MPRPPPILSSLPKTKPRPQPPPFPSLPKITFPSPFTVGTDIVYIPRIHEILTRRGGRPGNGKGWAFVNRILREEELGGFRERFGGALERYEGLCGSLGVARGLRGGFGLGAGGRVDEKLVGKAGMVEGGGKEEGIMERFLGKGFWEMVWKPQKGRSLDGKMDKEGIEEKLSREGVVMAVLKEVVDWKVLKGREELRTPWGVLIESLKKEGNVQVATNEVLNAMKVSIGDEGTPREEHIGNGGNRLQQEEKLTVYKPLFGNKQDRNTTDKNAHVPTAVKRVLVPTDKNTHDSNQSSQSNPSDQVPFSKSSNQLQRVLTFGEGDLEEIIPKPAPLWQSMNRIRLYDQDTNNEQTPGGVRRSEEELKETVSQPPLKPADRSQLYNESALYKFDSPELTSPQPANNARDETLDQNTNSDQNSGLVSGSELEAKIFANLTAGRPFNIEKTEGSQNSQSTPLQTPIAETLPKDPSETKSITDHSSLSVNLPPNIQTSSLNQEDINLFLALESSLLTKIRQAELGLQKPAIFLAGRFAAKEAIMKAHHSCRLTYHDIVILAQPPDENGSRPPVGYVLDDNEAREVKFSISHHEDYATATAMVAEPVVKVEREGKSERKIGGKGWHRVRKSGGEKEVSVRRVRSDVEEKEGEKREQKEAEKNVTGTKIEGETVRVRTVTSGTDEVPRFLW